MRKLSLLYCAALPVIMMSAFLGCSKKASTINDGQIIETPYSLYFTDIQGALYNSNDGKTTKVVFTSDGNPSRSFVNYDKNILWARTSLYVSTDNGVDFNYSMDAVDLAGDGFVNVYGKPTGLNQSMMINVPDWNDVYVASRSASAANVFGMAENYSGGALNTWEQEDSYDTIQFPATPPDAYVTSFTYLKDTVLLAYGAPTQLVMIRRGSGSARWNGIVATTGIPLDSSKAWYSLGHINNRAILIDNKGTAVANGGSAAYYSDDNGVNWNPLSGLPANTPIICINSPFEQICLVGTDGMGLYLLNPNTNTFQPNNNGLPSNLTVRNIAFKENIFKNGNIQQYVYLATNLGIYQSSDMGVNWVLTIPGNFVNIY